MSLQSSHASGWLQALSSDGQIKIGPRGSHAFLADLQGQRPATVHGGLKGALVETGLNLLHIGRSLHGGHGAHGGHFRHRLDGGTADRLSRVIQQYQGQIVFTDPGCFRVNLDPQLKGTALVGSANGQPLIGNGRGSLLTGESLKTQYAGGTHQQSDNEK